jgi:hypothetical protein
MKIWFLRSHQKNANLQKNVKKQTVSKAATNAAKRKQGFDWKVGCFARPSLLGIWQFR